MKKAILLSVIAVFSCLAKVHATGYEDDMRIYRSTFIVGNVLANANITKISTGDIVIVDYTSIATGTLNIPTVKLTIDFFDTAQLTSTANKSWRGFPVYPVGIRIPLDIEVTTGAYININGLDAGTTAYVRWYVKSRN